jgi:hypothetical protein
MWKGVDSPLPTYNGPCFQRGDYWLLSLLKNGGTTWHLLGDNLVRLPGSWTQRAGCNAVGGQAWANGEIAKQK